MYMYIYIFINIYTYIHTYIYLFIHIHIYFISELVDVIPNSSKRQVTNKNTGKVSDLINNIENKVEGSASESTALEKVNIDVYLCITFLFCIFYNTLCIWIFVWYKWIGKDEEWIVLVLINLLCFISASEYTYLQICKIQYIPFL
jgi:hypothetical protein